IEKIAGETGLGMPLLLQRQNGHGQFGEIFEAEIIEPALLGQHARRIEIIAPEAATIADPHSLHAALVVGPSFRTVRTRCMQIIPSGQNCPETTRGGAATVRMRPRLTSKLGEPPGLSRRG